MAFLLSEVAIRRAALLSCRLAKDFVVGKHAHPTINAQSEKKINLRPKLLSQSLQRDVLSPIVVLRS